MRRLLLVHGILNVQHLCDTAQSRLRLRSDGGTTSDPLFTAVAGMRTMSGARRQSMWRGLRAL